MNITAEIFSCATRSNVTTPSADKHTFDQQRSSTGNGITDMTSCKIKQSRRIRAKQVRPRIIILAALLAYLATSLTIINIGLLHISDKVEHHFGKTQLELQALTSAGHREQMLYTQLDDLLTKQLSGKLMETHEECLVRGLNEANDQISKSGFRYPDIRDRSMHWAAENCMDLAIDSETGHKHADESIAGTTDRMAAVKEAEFDWLIIDN